MSSKPADCPDPVAAFSYEDVGGGFASRSEGASVINPGMLRIREDELAQQLKQARATGVQEGEQKAAARNEDQMSKLRQSIAKACEDFGRERQTYYNRVEVEVVHLALAIAAKILHREAQVDRMVLAGVIRASLQKLQAGSKAKLRICPSEARIWRDYINKEIEAQHRPEVVEDSTLAIGACVLETELGTAELGVEAQLKEIETGLSDLLAHRPQIL